MLIVCNLPFFRIACRVCCRIDSNSIQACRSNPTQKFRRDHHCRLHAVKSNAHPFYLTARSSLFEIYSLVNFSGLIFFSFELLVFCFSTQSILKLGKMSDEQMPTKMCNVLENFVAIFAIVILSID